MRLLLGILAAFGIYITVGPAIPSSYSASLMLRADPCPPALAETMRPGLLGPGANSDAFVWKDYQDPDTLTNSKTPPWQMALGVAFKLGLVVALIYAVLFGYKRLLGIRAAGALGGRIRIVESTRLAGTQSLVLVEANDRYLLLGSNGAGVLVKLMDWPVGDTVPAPEDAAFARALTAAGTGRAASPPAADPAAKELDDFDGIIETTIRQVILPPAEGEA